MTKELRTKIIEFLRKSERECDSMCPSERDETEPSLVVECMCGAQRYNTRLADLVREIENAN